MGTSNPPPEKPDAIRNRSWIIYSFWAVILFLGLPTWLQTTSIPRAALPVQDMLTWSSTPETQAQYIVPIRISAPQLSCDVAQQIVTELDTLVNEQSKTWGFRASFQAVRFPRSGSERVGGPSCHVETVLPENNAVTLDIELQPGSTFNLDVSSSAAPAIATYSTKDIKTVAPNLAEAIKRVLADEEAAVAYQYFNLGRSDPGLQEYVSNLSGDIQKSIRETAARAFKPSPEYHLTFSLFTPRAFPSSWDIEATLNQHINPLVHALSTSVNISIATQVQVYSSFSPSIEPYQEDSLPGWYLRQNDLTAFVNTAEWPLSPSIGSGPTINFVLYVPSKRQSPLRIEGNHDAGVIGGSWIVPQWGGITILNCPIVKTDPNDPEFHREDVIAHLTADLLRPAFDIFQTQLLSLLGVPSSASISLPLRLKAYQRLLALSLHFRTTSNLGSLARLSQHLSSIPIPKHVSELVAFTMDSLRSYQTDSDQPRKIAATNAGYKASEKAFFDKSMVGQVYFPDEHKVAVYLPLLGPIGVPLLVSLIREIKALKARFTSR